MTDIRDKLSVRLHRFVRPVKTLEDVERCIEIAEGQLHRSGNYNQLTIDRSEMYSIGEEVCITPDSSTFSSYITLDGGAFILGYVTKAPMFWEHIGYELTMMKAHDSKVSPLAIASLVLSFENWARSKGAVEVHTGNSMRVVDSAAIDNFYTRLLGYELFSTMYRRKLR